MHDIEFVLRTLDQQIATDKAGASRRGYFASMYRRVTQRVKEGIIRGDFEDGERMARFDRAFAEHYFHARTAAAGNAPLPKSWGVAFSATTSAEPVILQHLLLGMNAHIYLDLGIAAAQVAPGPAYAGLQHDFDAINRILLAELEPTQERLNRLSPWMGLLDWVLGRADEHLAGLGLQLLRGSSWEFGQQLAATPQSEWAPYIAERDEAVAALAHLLLPTGWRSRIALALIRSRETRDIRAAITALE